MAPQPGTVIHGTLREEDLIPAFIAELPEHTRTEYEARWDAIQQPPVMPEDADVLLEELFDVLDAIAPDGHYFGAHPGDGSDFGFWTVEEGE